MSRAQKYYPLSGLLDNGIQGVVYSTLDLESIGLAQ